MNILKAMKFPSLFIEWIKACLTTTRFSINVGLEGYFHVARGIRQGDPLSPYLLVTVMNVLSLLMLDYAVNMGVF